MMLNTLVCWFKDTFHKLMRKKEYIKPEPKPEKPPAIVPMRYSRKVETSSSKDKGKDTDDSGSDLSSFIAGAALGTMFSESKDTDSGDSSDTPGDIPFDSGGMGDTDSGGSGDSWDSK